MQSIHEWQAAGEEHRYNSQRVFFRDTQTDKPPLVLIHGFPTASWDWHLLWSDLESTYRLVAMDLLGFGFSDKPAHYDYSLVDQAAMIQSLLSRLKISEYTILAHDYGDSVAQELLARAHFSESGETLVAVTFLNGGLFPETHRPRPIQRLLMSPLGPLIARLTSRPTFDNTMTGIFGPDTPPSKDLLDAFWEMIERDQGRRVFPKLIRYMAERKVMRNRWVEAMQETRIPLQLICGETDPVSGAHLADRAQELIPRMRIERLPSIGHYPQVEDADAVLKLFHAFSNHRV